MALPGQPGAETPELSAEEQARGHVPDAFRRLLTSVLQPGTTMLVTRESLQTSGTGARMAVLEADDP